MRSRLGALRPAGQLGWVSKASGIGAACCIAAILVIISADVIRRSFFGKSVPGSNLYCEVLLVASAFLALGLAERRKEHVATSILVDRVRDGLRKAIILSGLLICIGATIWVLWASIDKAYDSWAIRETRVGLVSVPIWPARAFLALGYLVFLCELIRSAVLGVTRDQDEGMGRPTL